MGQDVYDLLSKSKSLNMWEPEKLENIHETMSIDFMISAEESVAVQNLLKKNAVKVGLFILKYLDA